MTSHKNHESTGKSIELQDLGNGHWRAVCGDRSFRTDERDGDLWVDHRELASFFGYVGKSGPTKLKELLARCQDDGLILHGEVVSRLDTNKNDDVIERIDIQRKAALCLAMRCTLPNAVKLARAMADVFEAWLDRRHQTPTIDLESIMRAVTPVLVEIVTRVTEPLVARLSALETLIVSRDNRHGLLGRERAREILNRIQFLADCFYSRHSSRKEWSRKRGQIESEVRKAANLAFGRRWEDLPESRESDALLCLKDIQDRIPAEVRAEHEARRKAEAQQKLAIN